MTPSSSETKWVRLFKGPEKAMLSNGVDLLPGKRLYRYLTWEAALRTFETNQLRLRSPREWDDPYERWWCDLLFKTGTQLEGVSAFAACWTTRYRDEPYWRLYSHGGSRPVVRLSTTVERLNRILVGAIRETPAKVFMGPVRYRSTSVLERSAASLHGSDEKRVSSIAARLLHMKRMAFRFESEVRTVWIERGAVGTERYVPLQATAVFDRVMLGPSVPPFQARTIRKKLEDLGMDSSCIKQSLLYADPAC